MKKSKYIVKNAFRYQKKLYLPDDIIELEEKQANIMGKHYLEKIEVEEE